MIPASGNRFACCHPPGHHGGRSGEEQGKRGERSEWAAGISFASGEDTGRRDLSSRVRFVENSPVDSLYVCQDDDKVVGVLGFRLRENVEVPTVYGEVSVVVVNQDERRRGIGRFLMRFAEQIASEQGCIGLWRVSGLGRTEEAHRFYRELGYEATGY